MGAPQKGTSGVAISTLEDCLKKQTMADPVSAHATGSGHGSHGAGQGDTLVSVPNVSEKIGKSGGEDEEIEMEGGKETAPEKHTIDQSAHHEPENVKGNDSQEQFEDAVIEAMAKELENDRKSRSENHHEDQQGIQQEDAPCTTSNSQGAGNIQQPGQHKEIAAQIKSDAPAGEPSSHPMGATFADTVIDETIEQVKDKDANASQEKTTSTAAELDSVGKASAGEKSTLEAVESVGGVATSLADSMNFWDHCLDVLDDGDSNALMNLVDSMQADTMSTSFSGVEAPRVALNCLHWRLEERIGAKIPKPANLFMVEWDKEAQEELKLLDLDCHSSVADRPCLFSDISAFWSPDLQPIIHQLKSKPTMAVDVLAPRIAQGNATTRVAYCCQHGKKCSLKVARRHLAGSSCVAHSKRGAGLSLADPGVVHLLAWISIRLDLQEAHILQENTKGFPVEILKRFLFRHYWIDVEVLDACLFGVPQASQGDCIFSFTFDCVVFQTVSEHLSLRSLTARHVNSSWFCFKTSFTGFDLCTMQARERQFISMKHRVKVLTEVSPLSQFNKRFYRACSWHWREYFFLGSDVDGVISSEALKELDWARARPSSIGHGKDAFSAVDPDAFAQSLTTTEVKFLDSYRKAWPGQVYQLNQNPDSGFGATSQEWALATLISNCGLMFGDQANRWMLPTELLATQGFPVIPGVFNLADRRNPKLLCSFNFKREDRTSRHCGMQAGNSMHCFPMTVLQLFTLVNIKYQKVPAACCVIGKFFFWYCSLPPNILHWSLILCYFQGFVE